MTPKPPKGKFSPKRFPERKLVTIGAGFKCSEGVVLCVDSQETVGALKIDVPKMSIRPRGNEANKTDKIRAIFVGAGSGPLIDKLVDELWIAATNTGGQSLKAATGAMQASLLDWHRKISLAYGQQKKPEAEILIALCCMDGFGLYKCVGPLLNEVQDYDLVGIGEELGKFLSEQAIHYDLSLYELTVLGLHVIANANKYVDGCGGEIHLAWLRVDGSIEVMTDHETRMMSEEIAKISSDFQYAFLQACTFSPEKNSFNSVIDQVKKSVRLGRKEIREELNSLYFFKKALLTRPRYKMIFTFHRVGWPPFRLRKPK
jgi:hypothetical protein